MIPQYVLDVIYNSEGEPKKVKLAYTTLICHFAKTAWFDVHWCPPFNDSQPSYLVYKGGTFFDVTSLIRSFQCVEVCNV